LRWGSAAANAAVWDYPGMLEVSTRQVRLARQAGALGQLPSCLSTLGVAVAWSGDFATTAALIQEANHAAAAIGTSVSPLAELRLRALQGNAAETAALIVHATELAAAGEGLAAIHADWAAAVLYNGLARYEDALAAALRVTSLAFEPWVSGWALPELVEAAARAGDYAVARDALKQLTEITRACGNNFALGIEARCRALLSEGDDADRLYSEAIDRLGRTELHPELARARLLYGEWLRRERRRADARAQLRTAHETLATIGMEAFAERARRELTATGETVRKRSVETATALTAQEALIARLARDGLTNPQIGSQLFLSARTVEWHLRKVFTKLDIGSRRELHAALARPGQDGEPG
jgi:ATP/maltotriose-dependent transcriptional regulator MalT